MADENICETCQMEFPSSRALNAHVERQHKVPNPTPRRDLSIEEAKEKFKLFLTRFSASKLVNVALSGPAKKYNDPDILLSAEDAATIDAVASEIMDEIGTGKAKNIAPYLPWIGLFVLVGPIVFAKIDLINAHKAANPPEKKSAETKTHTPALTREDVQPDYGPSGGELDNAA